MDTVYNCVVTKYNCQIILTFSASKYEKTQTLSKWGIWTPTGVLVEYYPPSMGVGVWRSLDPPMRF